MNDEIPINTECNGFTTLGMDTYMPLIQILVENHPASLTCELQAMLSRHLPTADVNSLMQRAVCVPDAHEADAEIWSMLLNHACDALLKEREARLVTKTMKSQKTDVYSLCLSLLDSVKLTVPCA